MVKIIKRLLGFLVLFFLVFVGWSGYDLFLHPLKSAASVCIDMPERASAETVCHILTEHNLLPTYSPLWISMYIVLRYAAHQKIYLGRGEYFIPPGSYFIDVMRTLLSKPLRRSITFPEGFSVFQIIERLNKNPYLVGDIKSIPEEGSLFPSTYVFYKGDTRESIIADMKKEMARVTKKYALTRDQLILASIIQKEAANLEEMPMIAGVFTLRIKKKMRLQSDPTTIYGINKGDSSIYRHLKLKDLKHESPYNTYRRRGLPPSPICCPSIEAILAAIHPKETENLFFVRDPNKKAHIFSKKFEDHKKNKSYYLKNKA